MFLLLFISPLILRAELFTTGATMRVGGAERRAFSVIWNMPTARCHRRYGVSLPLSEYDITHNHHTHFLGTDISLFYQQRLGLYPRLMRSGSEVNGGIPQLGHLNAHLLLAEAQLEAVLRRHFAGLAVLDWEAWHPLWGRNFGARAAYQRQSEQLVRWEHPELGMKEVTSRAKAEFERAGRGFMLQTLRLGRLLRPRGLWGFYGFPECSNERGAGHSGYTGRCLAGTRRRSRQLAWLWRESHALYPSVYIPQRLAGHAHSQLMVRYRILEALRVASQHAPGPAVLPYARIAFRRTLHFLNQTDLQYTLGEAAALGADGVVLWGELEFTRSKHQCALLQHYIKSVLGVYVLMLRRGVRRCSELVCRGNGRCARRRPHSGHMIPLSQKDLNPAHLRTAFRCVCYHGWSGVECENRSAPGLI
ncbi:hyaluronidase-3 [Denticeps clupeoides]|uniref:hyaluronidase-3 n=1 Tax=Denticeps clupeoides TaxID=299321 RepID=UPI0010A40AE3|nr:hyaluronidase-3-like [Denticeps clupeoides]